MKVNTNSEGEKVDEKAEGNMEKMAISYDEKKVHENEKQPKSV